MTMPHEPPRSGDGYAAKGKPKLDHAREAVRRTDAWEQENLEEEQARWERRDPEYARICETARQAKNQDEEASRHADQAKADWDVRAAPQRQATDEAEKARHAVMAAHTTRRETARSAFG
jgi:hypothetical protein